MCCTCYHSCIHWLQIGLYNRLNQCALEQDTTESCEQIAETSTDSQTTLTQDHRHCASTQPEISPQTINQSVELGRLLLSQSPSEDTVLQLLQNKQMAQSFSLRDVLARRLPEIDPELEVEEEEDDCGSDGKTDRTVRKVSTQTKSHR